ncbi:MAG: PQQ-binding-like beta-propeller repeat protein [Planctomycetales bacterium]|nr:PQQ-binding-like beta-propeller repeat protein [Planctomycetales bacterium]
MNSHRHFEVIRFALVALVFTSLLGDAAGGGDWPQILGPERSGRASQETLAVTWPADGPPLRWSRPVGRGFAGVAVAGANVVAFHRVANQEVVEMLDLGAGKLQWKQAFPTNYVSTISDDDGPRCVPLIRNGKVFVLGAEGRAACLNLLQGDVIWSRQLARDYQLPPSYFGVGSTPILEEDKLLINLGGQPGAGIVALDAATGKTLWKATDAQASYSSPVATTVDDVRHVLFITRYDFLSLDPATGAERFRFPFGRRGPTVNAACPVVVGREVFLSSSYGVGARLFRLQGEHATEVWSQDELMSSQYVTSVFCDGYLYGVDGRDDVGPTSLRCFDAHTGKVQWAEDDFGVATIISAGNQLVLVTTEGELVLANASAEKYDERARARISKYDAQAKNTIPSSTVRALPALAHGRLLIRDTDTLYSFDLR